jgi:hypothetical protein
VSVVSRPASHAAIILVALTGLFAARVAGQALVAFFDVPWLPPMTAWYSGLLPYPVLLPLQLAILAAQAALDSRVWRRGTLAARPRTSRALRWFSYLYAAAMLLRWILTRTHLIPIVFHWVLAAYAYTLAAVSAGRTPRAAGR